MTENKINSNVSTSGHEIDLISVLRRIISIRRILYKAAVIGAVIGIIVSLSIPKQYTVNVTLSPEVSNSKGNNGLASFAASFLGSGSGISEGVDALNASLSSDIVASTPFLLELLQMRVGGFDKKENTTLETYLEEESSPWWNYIIGFPGLMIGGVKALFEKENVVSNASQNGLIELTEKVAKKKELLKNKINVSVNKKTGITSVSVSLQNAKITAIVADSVVHKLQESIIKYRISKAEEDCVYLEKLFEERQQEYYTVQKKYADYVDSHDNLILQSVRAEQERLQNDMGLAYQVYSQVATQLQVARAKVQEEKPVFAVVEPAVVPLKASGTGMKNYILLFMLLSVFGTMGWVLLSKVIIKGLKEDTKQ